ncbi:hypothetical protein DENSPDRAFT_557679 [Dentipellis sp. KUC8613]|nr:hypothetical protein DENSPDRAFT_557679 [Dentipellis sp. KUC8613]
MLPTAEFAYSYSYSTSTVHPFVSLGIGFSFLFYLSLFAFVDPITVIYSIARVLAIPETTASCNKSHFPFFVLCLSSTRMSWCRVCEFRVFFFSGNLWSVLSGMDEAVAGHNFKHFMTHLVESPARTREEENISESCESSTRPDASVTV